MSAARQRFYRDVSVEPAAEDAARNGFAILLDGKAVKTPAGTLLHLPGRALAEAVAEEWRSQGKTIRPETMLLTKLANTAIDRAGANRDAAIEQILALAKSDVICYRAQAPEGLLSRQQVAWDPLVAWAKERHGIAMKTTEGLSFVEQPAPSLEALARAVAGHDDFALTGLHAAGTLLGSAVIGLALSAGHLDPDTAFAAAHVDEAYQAEKWGTDAEAEARSHARAHELREIDRFLRLLRAD